PLKVGVVGCGIGKSHIEAYQQLPEQFQVVAVCDLDEGKARAIASEHRVPRVTTDIAELCRMDEVDIVDICTPSYLHYPQTLQALAAGKHVICEKPAAGSLKEIDDLLTAEAQAGKRVMPIFQYRFGMGAQKLKFLIEQGVTGRAYLTTAETAWRRRPAYYAVPWRGKWQTELGGALVTLAIHAHDLIYYLLGPARSVFARTKTLVNPIETEDTVSASVEMNDGSLCSLSVTTGSAHEISRHRFCFSHLSAESNTQPYHNTFEPWTFTADSPDSAQRIQETLSRFTPFPERFAGQFYLYAHALRNQTALPVTLADARAALELITAVYYSARTRQVVDLPLDSSHPYYASWRP
ncbi:MAG: Gfo/Idh/MocA family oxidoreductase, partial [Chloroflexota bacterium]